MIDVYELNRIIRNYVANVTGLDSDTNVIKANQDAPSPKSAYATVLITLVTPEGLDQITYGDQADPDVDLVETRNGVRTFNASINFYGDNSLNNAYKMQGASYEAGNISYLDDNDIGFVIAGSVLDLSEIELARFEERGQLDLTFNTCDTNENVVSSIQSQKIDATFEADSGETYEDIIEIDN